ncbi:Phage portal protein, HK97 [Novosphingobium aromaticivorans DSM 12444]|uniref:Phage portal protein, HK97 n=1 Tax=Novosphingobium aromaticivorans (strain ATCC 700278 / DSM 12444 / CCUG 56034 / CIP 105152 / NBRC 16084 / F199) TaxID=279238 RepID=Q2GAM9_NOVAD|nr:phage portal protein [Novosphingobium aromaticivorans]ABD25094.1 Phage portal protein, HK97 [Novosphingobium aromaticivorans DSM 12444]SCY95932.1 phage portal protein, HK97 family [Novosphingobium aromaticivorans]
MSSLAPRTSWLAKATTALRDWLVLGPDPKIRDPQNSSRGGNGAGVTVNDQAAMRLSAFWGCVRLISSTIGSLPVPVYTVDQRGVRSVARESALYRVLHDSPNADQTPVDYMECAVISLLLRGNHYARKLMEGGRLVGLEPINPAIVSVRRRSDGRIGYRWTEGGENFDLTEDEVFHVRGFGGGPLGGLSTVEFARESLGVAIAADRAASAIFANGVNPTGIMSTDMPLTAAQQAEAEELIVKKYQGAHRMGVPMVLGHGLKWNSITMKADDAQLLQSRGWSVEEICRWFGVPPFMIGHNEKTTSWGTGIEQMLLGFQKFTLNPYLRRIEQAVRKQLITPIERARGLTAEFNLEGLLRADSAGRASFYDKALKSKWMVINEVRAKENLAPVPWGDEPIVQQQDVPLSDQLDALREAIKNAQDVAGLFQKGNANAA